MAVLLNWALTNVADVKESMNIASGTSSYNNLIIRKINQATNMIEAYCGLSVDHHFKETTYTDEYYDGRQLNQLTLRARPVSVLTSFQFRDTTLNYDNFENIDSQIYFLDANSGVIDLNFTTSISWKRFKVTYTAGYATIPDDLAEACVTLAVYMVQNAAINAPIRRKTEGSRSMEFYALNITDSIITSLGLDDMLARYKNYAML